MPKHKKKKTKKQKPTVVVQASTEDGSLQMVGIGNLRVIITYDADSDSWFARGLEIDYAAQGESLKDVKKRFYEGLRQTVQENLTTYGDVTHILKVAPPEVWAEYFTNAQALRKIHSQVSTYQLQIATEVFPVDLQNELTFEGISYIPAAGQAMEQPHV